MHSRPVLLSNAEELGGFTVAFGFPPDDEVPRKALPILQRNQHLDSNPEGDLYAPQNPLPLAVPVCLAHWQGVRMCVVLLHGSKPRTQGDSIPHSFSSQSIILPRISFLGGSQAH